MKKSKPEFDVLPLRLRAIIAQRRQKINAMNPAERDDYLRQATDDGERILRYAAYATMQAEDERDLSNAFARHDRTKLDKSKAAEEAAARLAGSNLASAWIEITRRIDANHLQLVSDIMQAGANYNQIGRLRLARDAKKSKARSRCRPEQVKRDIEQARVRCRELDYFWRGMKSSKSASREASKSPLSLNEAVATKTASISPSDSASLEDILEQVAEGAISVQDAKTDIASLLGASMT